jgi:hypothetical protein
MYVNVKTLRAHMHYHKAKDESDGRARESLTLTVQTDDMDYPVKPMLHSHRHVVHLVDCLLGNVDWSERYSFSDVSYVVEAGTDGLRIRQGLGQGATAIYATFPGEPVARGIMRLHVSEDHQEAEWTASPEQIANWKMLYGPRIKVVFHGDAADLYKAVVRGNAWTDLVPEEQRTRLKDDVQALARIARNHSDSGKLGKPWIVHISIDYLSKDDGPPSFYWEIHDEYGDRFLNGGIIAHAYRVDTDDDTSWYEREIDHYEYSTHT